MCSFRGSFANRGNGTELRSSDVVVRVTGLELPKGTRKRFAFPSLPLPFGQAEPSYPFPVSSRATAKGRLFCLVRVTGLEPARFPTGT